MARLVISKEGVVYVVVAPKKGCSNIHAGEMPYYIKIDNVSVDTVEQDTYTGEVSVLARLSSLSGGDFYGFSYILPLSDEIFLTRLLGHHYIGKGKKIKNTKAKRKAQRDLNLKQGVWAALMKTERELGTDFEPRIALLDIDGD